MTLETLSEHRTKTFVVTTICRDNLIDCLIDMELSEAKEKDHINIIDSLSDEQMEEIAAEMAEDIYKDHDYWEHLQCIFERIVRDKEKTNKKIISDELYYLRIKSKILEIMHQEKEKNEKMINCNDDSDNDNDEERTKNEMNRFYKYCKYNDIRNKIRNIVNKKQTSASLIEQLKNCGFSITEIETDNGTDFEICKDDNILYGENNKKEQILMIDLKKKKKQIIKIKQEQKKRMKEMFLIEEQVISLKKEIEKIDNELQYIVNEEIRKEKIKERKKIDKDINKLVSVFTGYQIKNTTSEEKRKKLFDDIEKKRNIAKYTLEQLKDFDDLQHLEEFNELYQQVKKYE